MDLHDIITSSQFSRFLAQNEKNDDTRARHNALFTNQNEIDFRGYMDRDGECIYTYVMERGITFDTVQEFIDMMTDEVFAEFVTVFGLGSTSDASGSSSIPGSGSVPMSTSVSACGFANGSVSASVSASGFVSGANGQFAPVESSTDVHPSHGKDLERAKSVEITNTKQNQKSKRSKSLGQLDIANMRSERHTDWSPSSGIPSSGIPSPAIAASTASSGTPSDHPSGIQDRPSPSDYELTSGAQDRPSPSDHHASPFNHHATSGTQDYPSNHPSNHPSPLTIDSSTSEQVGSSSLETSTVPFVPYIPHVPFIPFIPNGSHATDPTINIAVDPPDHVGPYDDPVAVTSVMKFELYVKLRRNGIILPHVVVRESSLAHLEAIYYGTPDTQIFVDTKFTPDMFVGFSRREIDHLVLSRSFHRKKKYCNRALIDRLSMEDLETAKRTIESLRIK